MALKDIIQEIKKLSTADQYRLKEFFAKSFASYSASEPVFKEVSERKHKDGFTCSHCHSNNTVRFGKYNVKMGSRTLERQRYRCKDCGKTFTDVTNTPLHRTHLPHKWLEFVQCMIEGYSLRKSAELLVVHYVTLFYWRHKLLSALKEMDFEHFEGIVEMDETYFLFLEKGSRKVEGRKARKRGGSSSQRGISKELKGWINRFNGVATKYLDHYLSWFQFLDQIKHRNDDMTVAKMIVECCLFSTDVTYDKLRLSKFSIWLSEGNYFIE